MATGTANMDQRSQRRAPAPQVVAARAYQKTRLTEGTEEELLATYAPVISQMVHRFAPLVKVTVDVDDLKNIASLALIQAAHGYDPGQGMSFESYARMRIRGAILDEIRKSQPLSRTEYSRRRELENSIESLRIELNRQPTEEEVANRLGITVNEYQNLLDRLRPIIFVPLHQMFDGIFRAPAKHVEVRFGNFDPVNTPDHFHSLDLRHLKVTRRYGWPQSRRSCRS